MASSLRVNRAADDAANLAISETMRANIGGLIQGVRNAEQAVNLTQVTEGTLNEVNSIFYCGPFHCFELTGRQTVLFCP